MRRNTKKHGLEKLIAKTKDRYRKFIERERESNLGLENRLEKMRLAA